MGKFYSALLFLVASLFVTGCQAEQAPQYQADKHYFTLPQPVRTSDPSRIEVAEVFWYGCGGCFKFSPMVDSWKKTLADDVVLVRSPSTLGRRQAEVHTRAYYTARALGLEEELHNKIFNAIHLQGKRLLSEREIADVFVAAGVDRDKFSKVFNSFGVNSQSMQAQSRDRAYQVTGTPSIIVNGKYRVSGSSAGGFPQMLEVAEYLIEKERNERK